LKNITTELIDSYLKGDYDLVLEDDLLKYDCDMGDLE
jgi:hypothetical protein